jgi:hypothetical protein
MDAQSLREALDGREARAGEAALERADERMGEPRLASERLEREPSIAPSEPLGAG